MSDRSQWRNFLLPLVPVYRAGLALREVCLHTGREPIRRLRWPVVSVGNLSTGGAGKTPLTIALARALTQRGIYVDVLSRGYGRADRAASRVDPDGTAEEFGDEPLLIARQARVPVYVAPQRYEAGLLAEQEKDNLPVEGDPAAEHDPLANSGQVFNPVPTELRPGQGDEYRKESSRLFPIGFWTVSGRAENARKLNGAFAAQEIFPGRVHILDDGFQHRQLARNVDIVLLNRQDWGDFLLPAGNLREPVEALRRAQVIAIPAEEPPLESVLRNFGWTGLVWRLRRQMEAPAISGPVVAFCGIARPEQFFAGLEAAGMQVASRICFRDHHRFLQHDVDCLLDAVRSVKAVAFVTTEKDRVRMGALAGALAASVPLHTANLRVEIEDEAAAIDWLAAQVESHKRN